MPRLLQPVTRLGATGLRSIELVGRLGMLVTEATVAARHLVVGQRGRRTAWRNLGVQMCRVGVDSIAVVALVTFSVGAIIALQVAPVLQTFGVTHQLPRIVGVSMVRELGPLIGAVVLTGFAGASIAAELGTMAVGEELKALRAHAISPMRFLIVPRVLATTIMTTCLAVWCNVVAILGGMMVSFYAINMPFGEYLQRTAEAIDTFDFVSGLIKAACFGLVIGSLACHLGSSVRGGAQGVGAATTRTVVTSIVMIIIIDLLFTSVFYALGW